MREILNAELVTMIRNCEGEILARVDGEEVCVNPSPEFLKDEFGAAEDQELDVTDQEAEEDAATADSDGDENPEDAAAADADNQTAEEGSDKESS